MTPHDAATFFAGCALGISTLSPLIAWRVAVLTRRNIPMAISQQAQDAIAALAAARTLAATATALQTQLDAANATITALQQDASDTNNALEEAAGPPAAKPQAAPQPQ